MSLTLEKNRFFAVAVTGLLVLAFLAYVAGPLILARAIEVIYHSQNAAWSIVMQHREAIGLENYQVKAASLFRYSVAVGAVMLLTLAWVLWDHEKPYLSLHALAFPALNARTLGILGSGLLSLLSIRGYLPYLLLLLVALATLFAREEWGPFVSFNRALTWILRKQISLPLVLCLGMITFFIKFPPAQFGSLIFFDDYPTIYTVTVKGWEMLKQGGIFGWDARLMGGYHTVSDVSHNEIFFMLPFLPFGFHVGFHLMLMFFYVLFPFLLYGYARLESNSERLAIAALWIGLFTVFGFFDNLLFWGMVNSFIGLSLMILNLILFALMRRGQPYADFFLMLSLSLTLYAAGGFFAYSLLLLGLDFLWHFDRKMLPRLAFVMSATFLVTLTFTYHFLRFPSYFVQSDEIYAPPRYTMAQIAAQSIAALSRHTDPRFWLLGRPIRYQGLFIVSIPILLSLVSSGWQRWRRRNQVSVKAVVAAVLVMLLSLLVSPSVDMFISRIRFVLPVILALAYAAWLSQEERTHPAPFLLVLTLLLTMLPSRLLQPIHHEASLQAYNGPLLDQIEALDSGLVLLESMGGYDLATEGSGSSEVQATHVHLESFFPLETSKSYLANNQEGYHHSIYRRNFITSGAFRGRLLSDWPKEEIKAFLASWGVKHLVLWSNIAKDYFQGDGDYRQLWSDGFWAIYEYTKAVPGDVVASQGSGIINVRGYFDQDLQLHEVRRGDLITLRMNYFPAWRAYYGDQELELVNNEGFMAFVAPSEGSYTVKLAYPRYTGLSVLALITVVLSFWLSRRYASPQGKGSPR